MFSFLRLICCLPCQSQISPTKKSNLATLREVLLYLYELDDNDQLLINAFIRHILAELSGTDTSSAVRASSVQNSSEPLVTKASLDGLRETIRLRTNPSRPVAHDSSANDSQVSIGFRLPPSDYRRPSTASAPSPDICSPGSPYSDLVQHFTPTQLELLLHLDGVKHWPQYAAVSSLGSDTFFDLPSFVPRPCSVTQAGRLRVASWNLNRFTLAKAHHPGFREIVCLTILRAQLSLILLQEVASLDVANVLCSELNSPTLPHVRQWVSNHPSFAQWDVATSIQPTGVMFRGKEYALFIYNKHSGVQIRRTSLLEPQDTSRSDKLFSRSPCYALCHLRSFRVVFVSVHLKSRGLRSSMVERTTSEVERLEALVQAFYDTQPGGSQLIIAGDFNLHPGHEAFSGLKKHGFHSVLPDSQSTTTSVVVRSDTSQRSSVSNTAYDNAWLSPALVKSTDPCLSHDPAYMGEAGVICGNELKHPLIPDDTGAGANGFVSDHCPIWFDLYVP